MDYHELLRRHDHPTHGEFPPDFDYRRAMARFTRFVNELSAALGVQLDVETNGSIQDASFHSQIYLPSSSGRYTLMRFSNFGDMVTVAEDDPVPEPTSQLIQNLLAQHGYVYVPASVLEVPYDGNHPGVDGIRTWWIRYFDWL